MAHASDNAHSFLSNSRVKIGSTDGFMLQRSNSFRSVSRYWRKKPYYFNTKSALPLVSKLIGTSYLQNLLNVLLHCRVEISAGCNTSNSVNFSVRVSEFSTARNQKTRHSRWIQNGASVALVPDVPHLLATFSPIE